MRTRFSEPQELSLGRHPERSGEAQEVESATLSDSSPDTILSKVDRIRTLDAEIMAFKRRRLAERIKIMNINEDEEDIALSLTLAPESTGLSRGFGKMKDKLTSCDARIRELEEAILPVIQERDELVRDLKEIYIDEERNAG